MSNAVRRIHRCVPGLLIGAVAWACLTGCGDDAAPSGETRTVTVTASSPVSVPTPSTATTHSGELNSASSSPASSSLSSSSSAVPVDEEGEWQTTPPATHGPGSLPADSERALRAAAKRFVELWARPTVGEKAWRGALNPLMTPRGRSLIQWTDPANVPALRISGEPQRVPEATTGAFPVMVPTAQGNVVVNLVPAAPGGPSTSWLVEGFTLPQGMH